MAERRTGSARRARGRRALAGALLALAVSPPAGAREPARSVVDLSLEELMEIPVYAASRYEQSLSDAPSNVSVVSREEIRAHGYRTLAELLAGLPGIFRTSDHAYDFVGVRGFGRLGDYNSRILVLVNGRRTNEEIYGSAALGTDFPLDLDLVERVEVVRGPGSSLYGSNAFLAVVNVVTREAAAVGGAEVRAAAADHGGADGRLTFGRSFGGGRALLVSGSAGRSGGRDRYFPEFDAPETNHGRAEGRDGQEWFSLFASGRAGGVSLEALAGAREKDIPTASWGTMFNEAGHTLEDLRLSFGLAYEREVGAAGRLFALLSWQRYRYRASYPFDAAEEGEPALRVLNRDRADAGWRGGELRYVAEQARIGKLSLGVEYRDLYRLDQGNRDDGVAAPNLDSRESGAVLGAHVQDELRLGAAAIVNLGARYDRVSPRDEERLSPRVGLILRPGPATTVKLLYGEAFRSPNAYELYYSDGYSMKGNPGLDAETIRSAEVVLEQALGERLRASVSLYRWTIDGLIDQTLDPADGLLIFRNLAHAEARGAEAEVRFRIPRRLEARLGYSYGDAEDADTGERLSNSPRQLGFVKANLPLVADLVDLGVEARYIGERRTVRGGSVDAAFPVGLTLTAGGGSRWWEASVGVTNLFDAGYESPVGPEHLQDSVAQDGRSIRVALTTRF